MWHKTTTESSRPKQRVPSNAPAPPMVLLYASRRAASKSHIIHDMTSFLLWDYAWFKIITPMITSAKRHAPFTSAPICPFHAFTGHQFTSTPPFTHLCDSLFHSVPPSPHPLIGAPPLSLPLLAHWPTNTQVWSQQSRCSLLTIPTWFADFCRDPKSLPRNLFQQQPVACGGLQHKGPTPWRTRQLQQIPPQNKYEITAQKWWDRS